MAQPFSLPSDSCLRVSDPALFGEIQTHTANRAATETILRSLGRFGSDQSILRFEMIPQAIRAAGRASPGVAWNVRAVRAERVVEVEGVQPEYEGQPE